VHEPPRLRTVYPLEWEQVGGAQALVRVQDRPPTEPASRCGFRALKGLGGYQTGTETGVPRGLLVCMGARFTLVYRTLLQEPIRVGVA